MHYDTVAVLRDLYVIILSCAVLGAGSMLLVRRLLFGGSLSRNVGSRVLRRATIRLLKPAATPLVRRCLSTEDRRDLFAAGQTIRPRSTRPPRSPEQEESRRAHLALHKEALDTLRAAALSPQAAEQVASTLDAYEALVESGRFARSAIPYNVVFTALKEGRQSGLTEGLRVRREFNTPANQPSAAGEAEAGAGTGAGAVATRNDLEQKHMKQVIGNMPATDYVMLIIDVWDRLRATPSANAKVRAAKLSNHSAASASASTPFAALPSGSASAATASPSAVASSIVTNVSQRVILSALARARGRDWMRDGVTRYQATVPLMRDDRDTRLLSEQELTALSDFMEWLRRRIIAVRLEVLAGSKSRDHKHKPRPAEQPKPQQPHDAQQQPQQSPPSQS